MLVSACCVNITLVFIMSGGCVTKVHLDTWDLMCLLLSTGIVVSKALGWIVFTTLHNLRILNSSRTTSHAPLSSYSLQSHGTTLHSFSAAESLLVNLRLTCALCVPGPGLTITQPRRISIWRDGPGFWDPLGIIDFLTSVIVWNEFYSCLIVNLFSIRWTTDFRVKWTRKQLFYRVTSNALFFNRQCLGRIKY